MQTGVADLGSNSVCLIIEVRLCYITVTKSIVNPCLRRALSILPIYASRLKWSYMVIL